MDYDLIIMGAGPAGMTAGVYAARKMMSTLVITQDVGGQMLWTKDVENYMGYRYIAASDLLKKFDDQVKQFDHLEMSIADSAEKLEKIDGGFNVTTRNGIEYSAVTVILATGKRPRRLNVPGEKKLTGRGVAYCATCDAPLYKNKNVVVAGGGNSAAESLIELGGIAKKVISINNTDTWKADQILVDRIKKNEIIEFMPFHEISEVTGENKLEAVKVKPVGGGDEMTIPADGLFVEIGLEPNMQLVEGLTDLSESGEVIVDSACKTSVQGLFAAGDVTIVPEKQIIVAAGEGAKAALSAYKYWTRNQ